MTRRHTTPKRISTAEELGLKLLQSVREMEANKVARITRIEPHDVVHVRQKTGVSCAQFGRGLDIQ